ncbi:unnamed protein product [Arabis nemorensis]|uniref:Uncharacterized protein n=1 Tax=Arabis nemorensis TaxID=586526 RepID=A0A565BTZ5_9BRAS|nr:unnamed protein product [Arabis nemorensis]
MSACEEFTNVYVKNLVEGVTEDILLLHRLFSPRKKWLSLEVIACSLPSEGLIGISVTVHHCCSTSPPSEDP